MPAGLDAFGSEGENGGSGGRDNPDSVHNPTAPVASPAASSGARRAVTLLLVLLLTAGLAAAGAWQYQRRAIAAPANGKLEIHTNPAGLEVTVSGAIVGRTPLSIDLAPGVHQVRVGTASSAREFPVTMVSGGVVQHSIDVSGAVAPVAPVAVGSLSVETAPARMTVVVDGVERGLAPLTIQDLPAGSHQVLVRNERRNVRRTVEIKAGETLSLVISPIEPSIEPGWLTVVSPAVMQIREAGEIIGSTEAGKIMLASGDHDLEFVNDVLGHYVQRRVTIAPGRVVATSVELPSAMLSINAEPWAEVLVDGERIGETPIANLSVPIGSHKVTLRHPQLGERHETVLVTLKQPARLGVKMRRE